MYAKTQFPLVNFRSVQLVSFQSAPTLLISAFLIIRGLGRLIFANVAELEERRSISIGAVMSVLLSLLISLHWPTKAAWFMALSLSLEIALRGWAQIMVALWLKDLQAVKANFDEK